MDDSAPESNEPLHSPPEVAGWPTYMHARSLYLTTLRPSDVAKLWALVLRNAPENARLFTRTYALPFPLHTTGLRAIFTQYHQRNDPSRPGDDAAYIIVDTASHAALGLLIIHPHSFPSTRGIKEGMASPVTASPESTTNDPTRISCALFLTTLQRVEKGSEAMSLICDRAFEELGRSEVTFRTGTLHSTRSFGLGMLNVVRRQMHVREENQVSDLYVVKREAWLVLKVAIGAWMDAQERNGGIGMWV